MAARHFALILLAATALADAPRPPGATPVVGKCEGGLRPSVRCSTCAHCAYCGTDKGRAQNSGTCAVCAAARAAKAAEK